MSIPTSLKNSRLALAALSMGAALLAFAAPNPQAQAQQLTKLSYGTNWLAEAEHGGFY